MITNKFKRAFAVATVATFGLMAAHSASAATFDFADLADNNETFWVNNSSAGSGDSFNTGTDTWTDDSIGVHAFGNTYGATAETGDNFAYLDAKSGGKLAGLGVCSGDSTPTGQCDTPSDDNTGMSGNTPSGAFEYVTLTFSEAVEITDLVLRDDNHNILTSGVIGLSTAASFVGLIGVYDIATGISQLAGASSSTWTFAKITGGENFYVSVVEAVAAPPNGGFVPLPASSLLLLGALGGLGIARRRRKNA